MMGYQFEARMLKFGSGTEADYYLAKDLQDK